MARKYHQGRFTPINPKKYVGDINNIYFRSSWELKFLKWCDNNPSITHYCSEEVVIPYYDPVQMKMRRYFVDFAMIVKNRSGEVAKYLVEIKPNKERFMPTGTRKTKNLVEAVATYTTNQAKWTAAEAWAIQHNMRFQVIDEYDLGIKPRPKS